MLLDPVRIEVRAGGGAFAGAVSGSGPVAAGPLEVVVGNRASGRWGLIVANRSDSALAVRSVSLVFAVADVDEPLRMFRHGYQSWSPSGMAVLGVDHDPSTRAGFEFLQAVHHSDQRAVTSPEELRSEWVTLLADGGGGGPLLIGFEAGVAHDGTLRLRRSADGTRIELWAEAFFGDAVLEAGEVRYVHAIEVDGGDGRSAATLLDGWATRAGQAMGARVGAPYQVGWCSWYHYFDAVTEADLHANLALAERWPFEVFQLDDGYQAAIGDWLRTGGDFPSGLAAVAHSIGGAGYRPGVWLAPFLAAPDSALATEHPDWLARRRGFDGVEGLLDVWWNPAWGGGRNGFMYGLDTTNPEVLAHLEALARALVEMGFTYLKLDFTFAPSCDGVWADPGQTPAQRVRAGYAAVRRGAGEDAFILGCGVPLSHVVGLVDGNRIGQDVAPLWSLPAEAEVVAGYLDIQPATKHAYGNTLARSFMHRRLWLNDPDCLMLRSTHTELGAAAARTWARAVGVSGGMALVSDDLALLDDGARALLDEAVAIGRASDDAARTSLPAVAPDLLDHRIPTTFTAAGHTLVTDPTTGSSALRRPPSS